MPPPTTSTSKAGLGESMLLEEWPTAVARIKKNFFGEPHLTTVHGSRF
jgi:hypothetical protein